MVHAGETLIVTLISVGGSGTITYTVRGLPAYATAEGNTIRAAPTRADVAGDNTITVTANDGTNADSGSFVLTLANAAPAWSAAPTVAGLPSLWIATVPVLTLDATDTQLVLSGQRRVEAEASDADGDPVQLMVEFRTSGEVMTGTANLRSGTTLPLTVDLPVLDMGQHYVLDAWLQDSHGAQSAHVHRSDVIRTNTPPSISGMQGIWGSDGGGAAPTSSTFEVRGAPELEAVYRDVDGDATEVLVEWQPVGTPLTGTPTAVVHDGSYDWVDGVRYNVLLDLAVGTHYQVSWWFRDRYGAESPKLVQQDVVRIE